MAQSGHPLIALQMSAFGGKADIACTNSSATLAPRLRAIIKLNTYFGDRGAPLSGFKNGNELRC